MKSLADLTSPRVEMARGLFVTLLLALTCGIALSQCPSMFSGIENKEFDTPLSAGSDVDFSICGTVPKACTGSDICPGVREI